MSFGEKSLLFFLPSNWIQTGNMSTETKSESWTRLEFVGPTLPSVCWFIDVFGGNGDGFWFVKNRICSHANLLNRCINTADLYDRARFPSDRRTLRFKGTFLSHVFFMMTQRTLCWQAVTHDWTVTLFLSEEAFSQEIYFIVWSKRSKSATKFNVIINLECDKILSAGF